MLNQDKFKTAEERVKAFESQHCERYDECAQCQYNQSCGGIDGRSIGLYIMAHWLALEAAEEELESCPFCGSDMHYRVVRMNGVDKHWFECINGQCDYQGGKCNSKAEAIAAHNLVCRAVKNYKNKEV